MSNQRKPFVRESRTSLLLLKSIYVGKHKSVMISGADGGRVGSRQLFDYQEWVSLMGLTGKLQLRFYSFPPKFISFHSKPFLIIGHCQHGSGSRSHSALMGFTVGISLSSFCVKQGSSREADRFQHINQVKRLSKTKRVAFCSHLGKELLMCI